MIAFGEIENRSSGLLTEEELASSLEYMRPPNKAELHVRAGKRFRNGLNHFLNEISVANRQGRKTRMYAIDTVELFGAFSSGSTIDSSFAFAPFLTDARHFKNTTREIDDADKLFNEKLKSLDELVSHQLFFSGRITPVLLDDFAQEISESIQPKWSLVKEALDGVNEDSDTYSEKFFELVTMYFSDGSAASPQAEEAWTKFCAEFLPSLSSKLVRELRSSAAHVAKFSTYLQSGNYSYIRSEKVMAESGLNATRSLEFQLRNTLKNQTVFEFKKLENFFAQDEVQKFQDRLFGQICELFSKARPDTNRHQANDCDAGAIVQAHLVNRFFDHEGLEIEIDIVSRSSTLLDVMASLPPGKIDVSVRHPMFIPEIYELNPNAIHVMQKSLRDVTFTMNAIDEVESSEKTASTLRDHGRAVVSYLSDLVLIEQTALQNSETQNLTAGKVVGESLKSSAAEVIRGLKQEIDRGKDPFARNLWKRTSEIVAQLLREGLPADSLKKVEIRFVEVENTRAEVARKFYALRFVVPYVGVIFQFQSELIANLIQNKLKENLAEKNTGPLSSPNTISISFEEIVNLAIDTIQSTETHSVGSNEGYFSREKSSERTAILNGLEASLISAMLFASMGRVGAATSILVEVLRPAMAVVRDNEQMLSQNKDSAQILLALRELFLLRHHCERLSALKRTITPLHAGVVGERRSIVKNFGRAQRDLDIAVLMSEHAEYCILLADNNFQTENIERRWLSVPPAGSQHFNDGRHLITHVGGWIDQFLVQAKSIYTNWPVDGRTGDMDAGQRRQIMWTAAGFAKELVSSAYWMRRRRIELKPNDGTERYMYHMEARLLQSSLLLFVLHLAYNLSPYMDVIGNESGIPKGNHSLVYRAWPKWWARYKWIREEKWLQAGQPEKKMSFKMNLLIDPVCQFLTNKQNGEPEIQCREELEKALKEICDPANLNFKNDRLTMEIIAKQLLSKILPKNGKV